MNDLLSAARTLRPLVEAEPDATDRELTITRPVIDGLAESDLNHLQVPKGLGGLEADVDTTLDVLNAQQELVNARVALVSAQRDRVVASYTLLASVGRLSPQILGLRVPTYDAAVHYHQVRDSWAGVRTPDGR